MLFQLKLLHSIPNGPKVLTCCRCMTKPSNCEHIAKQSHLQIGNQSKVEWWCNSNTCLCKLKVTFSNFGRCRIWRKHHFMNSRFFIFNIHNVNFNAKGVTYCLFLFFLAVKYMKRTALTEWFIKVCCCLKCDKIDFFLFKSLTWFSSEF